MFQLICKRLQRRMPIASTTAPGYLYCTSSLKPTLDDSKSTGHCGLLLESAISASKKLRFEATDQPDSVLNLLKSNGFTETHIKKLRTTHPRRLLADPNKILKPNIDLLGSLGFCGTNLVKVINKEPRILVADLYRVVEFFRGHGFTETQICLVTMKFPRLYLLNPHRNLKPKFEYFKSLGFSGEEVAQLFSRSPFILERSLENRIMPSVQVVRRIVGTDGNVLKAIKGGYQWLLNGKDLEKILEPKVAILMNLGVPASVVSKLILLHPKALLVRTPTFSEAADEVVKMGFDPTNLSFVLAIRTLSCMSKSLRQRKFGVCCSFGMSMDEILSAFKSQPMCMIASEKKIRKVMGFFVNELKLKPSIIAKNSFIFLLSMEKRIIPRCSVLELLMSKDVIKGGISLFRAIKMTEHMFVEKYVSKYHNMIPEVVETHQGKIQFQSFPVLAENLKSRNLVGCQHSASRS